MGKYINYKNANGMSKGIKLDNTDSSFLRILAGFGIIGAMMGFCQFVGIKTQNSQTVKQIQVNDTTQNNVNSVYMFDKEQKTR